MGMEAWRGTWLFIRDTRGGSYDLFLQNTEMPPTPPGLLSVGGGAGTAQDTPGCSVPRSGHPCMGQPSPQDRSLHSEVLNKRG